MDRQYGKAKVSIYRHTPMEQHLASSFMNIQGMEADDYIDVHYQLNGGAFVLIPNWNSHGSGIHTLIDDFEKDTVVKSVGACDNLVIKVTFNNDSGYEELQMDDIFVYPNMEYVSSTTTQNTHNIAAGKTTGK